ncbi:hypothetical protein [Rhizobium mayense]|uniref:Nutrient deprivation-induced protein n=1 Tax=Rhizobium mayense TaxID=1312184 RepID=A0ABT7K336_9HYPH|nr:hypothetical protein [Rhizobium mayense]MDL2403026.1 hypothetical protein [Rhizobium mayense]
MTGENESSQVVEVSNAGAVDEDQVNAKILEVWQEMLRDESVKAEVAGILSVDAGVLDSSTPPVVATSGPAGVLISGILISVGTAFLVAAGKEAGGVLGKAAAEALVAAIRRFWETRMRHIVSPVGSNVLGEPKTGDE